MEVDEEDTIFDDVISELVQQNKAKQGLRQTFEVCKSCRNGKFEWEDEAVAKVFDGIWCNKTDFFKGDVGDVPENCPYILEHTLGKDDSDATMENKNSKTEIKNEL